MNLYTNTYIHSNKFGAIMKQLAEAGAIWAKPAMNDEDKDEDAVQPKSTPKRKATSKKMATKANGDNDEDNHGGNASASEDEDEPKTPKKKAKTTPKKVKKGKQDMTKSKATEVDEDDTDVIMKHEANAEEEMDELRIDDLKEEEDNWPRIESGKSRWDWGEAVKRWDSTRFIASLSWIVNY